MYVINQNEAKDTTITIVEIVPDYDFLKNFLNIQIGRNKNHENNTEINLSIDSIYSKIEEDLKSKIDSLKLNNLSIIRPDITTNIISSKKPDISRKALASLNRPLFSLPKNVKGYINSPFNSIGVIRLNSNEFKRNEKIEVTVETFYKKGEIELSPFYVSILEKEENSNYIQIWQDQFALVDEKSLISFSSNFKPGNYILEVGAYDLTTINNEYPNFHIERFNLRIE
ncbi:hypothetical protein [Algoriphagus litoralis]|uniref:hypothetical protein n=1 Tax=Algoriphagus litoralis TaxID=2202829 RepID=UPI000DBA31B3|nr:hypothetical protein [Algoriphagus litoralis]